MVRKIPYISLFFINCIKYFGNYLYVSKSSLLIPLRFGVLRLNLYVKNSKKWIQPECLFNSNTFFKFVKQYILEWATVLQMKKFLRKFVVPGTDFCVGLYCSYGQTRLPIFRKLHMSSVILWSDIWSGFYLFLLDVIPHDRLIFLVPRRIRANSPRSVRRGSTKLYQY